MKLLFVAFLFAIAGLYYVFGNQSNGSDAVISDKKSSGYLVSKCTTSNGRIVYGDIPNGTVCVKVETLDKTENIVSSRVDKPVVTQEGVGKYSCDSRKYCSQMTSCEEARYFLKNCPDVKMDGNMDGVPCESQWCS